MNNQVKEYLISNLRYIRLYRSRAERLTILMRHGRRYSAWYELNSKGEMCKWKLDNQERYDSAENKYLAVESEVRGFLNAYNMITGENLYYSGGFYGDNTINDESGNLVLSAESKINEGPK